MKSLFLLALLPLLAFAQSTVTIPSQTVTVVIPAQTIPLPATAPPIVTPPVTCTAPAVLQNGVCTTPVATLPASGVFWVYQNGQFNWTSHFSFNGTPNLADTSGKPVGGKADIAFTLATPFGGYQPYLAGGFDTSKYKYLTYSIKPTVANQIIATGFAANNDAADGPPGGVNVVAPGLTKYGPAPVVGQWATYKIPLADFGLTNPLVLKFSIADGSGDPAGSIIYFDNIGFSP